MQDPDLEWAAELIGNLPTLMKAPTLEELQQIFRGLFKTVYLDCGSRGPVVAIEPTPAVKQLLDVSTLSLALGSLHPLLERKEEAGSPSVDRQLPDSLSSDCIIVPPGVQFAELMTASLQEPTRYPFSLVLGQSEYEG